MEDVEFDMKWRQEKANFERTVSFGTVAMILKSIHHHHQQTFSSDFHRKTPFGEKLSAKKTPGKEIYFHAMTKNSSIEQTNSTVDGANKHPGPKKLHISPRKEFFSPTLEIFKKTPSTCFDGGRARSKRSSF
jgi:hypothetical protein